MILPPLWSLQEIPYMYIYIIIHVYIYIYCDMFMDVHGTEGRRISEHIKVKSFKITIQNYSLRFFTMLGWFSEHVKQTSAQYHDLVFGKILHQFTQTTAISFIFLFSGLSILPKSCWDPITRQNLGLSTPPPSCTKVPRRPPPHRPCTRDSPPHWPARGEGRIAFFCERTQKHIFKKHQKTSKQQTCQSDHQTLTSYIHHHSSNVPCWSYIDPCCPFTPGLSPAPLVPSPWDWHPAAAPPPPPRRRSSSAAPGRGTRPPPRPARGPSWDNGRWKRWKPPGRRKKGDLKWEKMGLELGRMAINWRKWWF